MGDSQSSEPKIMISLEGYEVCDQYARNTLDNKANKTDLAGKADLTVFNEGLEEEFKAVSIEQGGTGAITVDAARENLNIYSKTEVYSKNEVDFELNSTSMVVNTALNNKADLTVFNEGLEEEFKAVSIEQGGTGATGATQALKNLGITVSTDVAPETNDPWSVWIQVL